jgi:hypothetical protein
MSKWPHGIWEGEEARREQEKLRGLVAGSVKQALPQRVLIVKMRVKSCICSRMQQLWTRQFDWRIARWLQQTHARGRISLPVPARGPDGRRRRGLEARIALPITAGGAFGPPSGGTPFARSSCFHFPYSERAKCRRARGASIRGDDGLSYWPLALAELFLHASKMTSVWSCVLDRDFPHRANQRRQSTWPRLADQNHESTLQSFVTSHLRKAGRHSTRRPRIEPQRRHQTRWRAQRRRRRRKRPSGGEGASIARPHRRPGARPPPGLSIFGICDRMALSQTTRSKILSTGTAVNLYLFPTLASQSIVTTLWGGRGPILHVALSLFHRKEDAQYRPPNPILPITDVGNRLKPASFVVRTSLSDLPPRRSVGLQLQMGFGQEAVSPNLVD